MADVTTPACLNNCGRGFSPAQDGPIVAVGIVLGVALLAGLTYIVWAIRRARHLENLRRRQMPEANIYGSLPRKRKEPEENVYETLGSFRRGLERHIPAEEDENDDLSQRVRTRSNSILVGDHSEIPADISVKTGSHVTSHTRSFSCTERSLHEVKMPKRNKELSRSLVDLRLNTTFTLDQNTFFSSVGNIHTVSETVPHFSGLRPKRNNRHFVHYV